METHKQRVLRKYKLPDVGYSVEELSKITGISSKILQEVYNRGTGAYKNNLSSVRLLKDFSKNPDTKKFPASSRLSKEAWSMARVYSFIDRGTTFFTADSDLAKKI